MKYLVLVLLAVTAASASASERCMFSNSDAWKEFGKSLSLKEISVQEIRELDTLTKQQLIIAANDYLSEYSGRKFQGAVEAVEELREGSEANDLDVSHFRLEGEKYTLISFYPGGNQYGWIFEYGSRRIVGTIADSDIDCR